MDYIHSFFFTCLFKHSRKGIQKQIKEIPILFLKRRHLIDKLAEIVSGAHMGERLFFKPSKTCGLRHDIPGLPFMDHEPYMGEYFYVSGSSTGDLPDTLGNCSNFTFFFCKNGEHPIGFTDISPFNDDSFNRVHPWIAHEDNYSGKVNSVSVSNVPFLRSLPLILIVIS